MKKFAILTSVLALAACGGGSGGHNGAVSGNNTATYVDPVRTSNAEVTGMVSNSKYQIARYVANKLGDDASSVNLSRTATHRAAFVPRASTGDVDYDTARELVDLAEWLAQDTTTRDEIIEKFNESKNKIKAALKLMDDMYCFVGGNAEKNSRSYFIPS